MTLHPKARRQTDWRLTCVPHTGRSLKSSLLRIRQRERRKTAPMWLHPARISSLSGNPLQVTRGAGAIGFSCPMSIRSMIPPESGFSGTLKRCLVSGEMTRQSSPNRCLSTYALWKVPSGWSKSTPGILPEDTMRFRCHFTLDRFLNAPSQAQATPSHPGNGAPRSMDHPTVASSGHMMASAGWERVTPRFGMINGASHGGRFSKALMTELRS